MNSKASKKNSQLPLTPRQVNLLFSVIKEFCDTGQTVGSKEIKDKYNFSFSSATIRKEFATLREKGYLFQPFTNSSSKPTEKAFKLFVNQLIVGLSVTNQQHRELKQKIFELEQQQANLNKEITRLLANQAGGVGFSVNNLSENFTGISNLIEGGSNEAKVADILEFLDNLDKYKKPLLEGISTDHLDFNILSDSPDNPTPKALPKSRLQTFFGKENPVVPLGQGYALVATDVYVQGNKSVIGLIVPTRLLAKRKNLELIGGLSEILNKEKSQTPSKKEKNK